MKICVFAYNTFGYACLRALLKKMTIDCLWTHLEPHHDGRHCTDLYRENVFLSNPNDHDDFFEKERFDVFFSFYYRFILSNEVLSTAQFGWNYHGSLLPNYRGCNPVNWAIIHGAKKTGATLHTMIQTIDAGDVLFQCEIPIGAHDNAGQVQDHLDNAAAQTLYDHLDDLLLGKISPTPQLIKGPYYKRRKPEDGMIDLKNDSNTIYNLVRGVLPYPRFPGAFLDNKRVIAISRTQFPEAFPIICGDGKMLFLQFEQGI